jgi:hypothetical protein
LLTIDTSFGRVLPGLAASRRAIGVELQATARPSTPTGP